jgi:4a-hydroxytetrahydrobiopterin dehydratase
MPEREEARLLTAAEIAALPSTLPRWSLQAGCLKQELQFPSFPEAVAYVNKVAAVAQQLDHHPDIFLSYRTVRLELITHKVNGLSPRDLALAHALDTIALERAE